MKTVQEEQIELTIKSLREQLAKERELRKELVAMLERCRGITEHYDMYSTNKEIEALIKKGT